MQHRRYFPLCVAITVCVCLSVSAAVPTDAVKPGLNVSQTASALDELVLDALRKRGIEPAPLCSDGVFLRRVYLDLIGAIPTHQQAQTFLEDDRPDKRAALIDQLLEHQDHALFWSLRWCDVLRVKAEFPINLWPNAVQAYHRWIYDSLAANKPYDQFARELLTSSGSNFRVPQVNFYRAIQGTSPANIAGAVGLTFMGTRIENWPDRQRGELEAFFSRVAFKGTAEWKEQVVYLDPAATEPLSAVLPDGTPRRIEAGQDPRAVFADWLIKPGNPHFARCAVNRHWAWIMGRGIIHQPDDIRPDNPPSNPALLKYLEQQFVESGYDLKQLTRWILNSPTYQRSATPSSDHPQGEALFAHAIVRQLEAEVLIDALCQLFGRRAAYGSPIPEPFTWVPGYNRSVGLADGSISSPFLEMFGRPSRDTGLMSERGRDSTDAQRLYMINSAYVQKMIQDCDWLKQLALRSRANSDRVVGTLYLTILSRPVTAHERAIAAAYFKTSGLTTLQATHDLTWALINSREFLYRH